MNLTLADVDFGRIDAESDNNLKDYFVDTGVLNRIAKGDKQFVIGRKGSGKTALFQQLDLVLKDVSIIKLEFSDYAWEKHKSIVELGLPKENAYTSSWIFTFLLSACKEWVKSNNKEVSKPAKALFKQIYGNEDAGALELLVDKMKRLRKLDLPNAGDIGGLGGFELEDMPEGATLARAANVWNHKLLALASKLYPLSPVTILVDRLDDGWDASEEIRNMLAGAIKAARDLNLKLTKPGRSRFVVVFLRSDIMAELEFNDKNKISRDIEYLEWDNETLLDVVNARIAKSLNIRRAEAWDAVFSQEQMRQKAFISSYLLKRTMQRPRDIIAFCDFCKDAALKKRHRIIETSDVYEGEKAYSRHIYDELIDEMHKQVDNHAALFNILRTMGYSRFQFHEWFDAVKKNSPKTNQVEASARLKVLFDFGIVGVPKVGGKGGGTFFEYAYQDRYLDPRFDGDLVVHPALRKQLDLKDAKAGMGSSSDGTDTKNQ
jgi:energy-coupling factor transporter ATP-binding protein EcfA2